VSFRVRDATVDDYPVFVRLFPELGVEDPVLTPEQFATRMLPRVVIVESDGAGASPSVGYASWNVYGRLAHLGNIVVDPSARGQGAGRALLDAVRERARAASCDRWYLNVKQDNTSALALYGRAGFEVERESWAIATAWSALAALPAAPGDAEPFEPTGETDAEVGADIGFPAERIALLRARPGEVLAAFREPGGGRVVAFAAFDPSFPGVYPVGVAPGRTRLLGSLFERLRLHARQDPVNVVVEGNEQIRDALVAVGARVTYALYRMSGPLA
jgi:GNAT superfamily N-acetyltransferase